MQDEQFTIPYGSNTYCGPAALAYVTRTDPDTAARHLRRVGNKRAIFGVSNTLLLKTLCALGVRYSSFIEGKKPPTLGRWLTRHAEGEYIVNITGHYIVVVIDDISCLVFDNRYHLGKSVYACPYLRRKVRAAWRIER